MFDEFIDHASRADACHGEYLLSGCTSYLKSCPFSFRYATHAFTSDTVQQRSLPCPRRMKFRMTYEVPRWTTLRGSPSVHSSFAATAFLANDEACTTRPPGHRLRPPTTDFPVPCRVPDGRRCAAHLLRTSAPASQPLLSWRMKKPALPALQYIDCALSQRICLCLACPRRMTLRGSPSMHFSSSLAATAFMANEETCTARPAVH